MVLQKILQTPKVEKKMGCGGGAGASSLGEVLISTLMRCGPSPAAAAVITYFPQFLRVLLARLHVPFPRQFSPPTPLNTLGLRE